jgi:hypothetical protein
MSLAAARLAAERARHEAELKANATAETLRNLTADPLVRLHKLGRLRDEHLRAGWEIRSVWVAITERLWPRVSRLLRSPAGSEESDWPPGIKRAYTERYAPWRDETRFYLVKGNHTRADLVFFVAVDGMGVLQTAKRCGLHDRVVHSELQIGLHRYCEIAGWIDESPTPQLPIRIAVFGR